MESLFLVLQSLVDEWSFSRSKPTQVATVRYHLHMSIVSLKEYHREVLVPPARTTHWT